MKKSKPSKEAQFVDIKKASGVSGRKARELSFAERMTKRKAEDREIGRLGDKRLAAMIRK